ncbi:conjugal transfer protein TrbE [Asticcacaulis taihuensis]|uniref:conjugal transfer protein TrbE n=1 Tax=Asticcacaulis taihuensis TaxID=260084 RepID=UPI0026F17117|nr:conjugal transfer protein TrbE [Asticcacaulis taihuensis]
MFHLAEYQRRPAALADYLPWAALIAPGTVLNKDGSFQRTAKFRGPDLDSSVPGDLSAISRHLSMAFKRLGERWSIFVEAQRRPSRSYAQSIYPDAASAMVDAERKAAFETDGAHFESAYFLTFVYMPPEDTATTGESWLFEGTDTGKRNQWERVDAFREQSERVFNQFETFMPDCRWLDDEETLTFLHSTVSTRQQIIGVPDTPMHLDALLADEPLTCGLAPMLGDAHLRLVTITGFPPLTVPGMLDDLNRLGFAYRWSTRAILMDKSRAQAVLGKIRRQWFAKRKSLGAILKEVMTNEQAVLVDNDASNKAADADAALQELGADYAGYAWVTTTLVVWDGDPAMADEKRRLCEKVIQGRGFACIPESLNAVDAWLGTLPGHLYANVRRPPISTLNLAHMMPASAVWAGPEANDHLKGPPLLLAKTEGTTPFRLSLHVGDVGHSLVIGPTGAGKSVLLALLALQFRRYEAARIIAFDFGRSLRAACLAMGGDWQDLGDTHDAPVSLQPLAALHDPNERTWAADWIASLLAHEGIVLNPAIREHLWSALNALATAPTAERTLTGLSVMLQSLPLKQALAPYCSGGAHGGLLDAERDDVAFHRVSVFETQGLVGTPAAPAVLSYLFHRIEGQLDGAPTFIIIDEGWLALDDEGFAHQLKRWLKTLRKANASVIFATQSLADIGNSPIATTLIESCPTRLFLPNASALEPQINDIYRQFGLNSRQIQLIARAMPKRDYYLQSPSGNRLFELGLGEVALALCATSSPQDQAAITRIWQADRPDQFFADWLRFKDVAWAADLITPAPTGAFNDPA